MNGAGRTRRIYQKCIHNLSRESWREEVTWKTSMWTEGEELFRDLKLWWIVFIRKLWRIWIVDVLNWGGGLGKNFARHAVGLWSSDFFAPQVSNYMEERPLWEANSFLSNREIFPLSFNVWFITVTNRTVCLSRSWARRILSTTSHTISFGLILISIQQSRFSCFDRLIRGVQIVSSSLCIFLQFSLKLLSRF